jgi:hypothetical protein
MSTLSTIREEHSAFHTTRIEGQGTQSAVDLKSYDVVSVRIKATWKRAENIQLPFDRKSLCEHLGSRDTKCSYTFVDPTEILNIILMLEHLKVFHQPVHVYYIENIHKWFAAQPEKVNNFFSYRKNLKF